MSKLRYNAILCRYGEIALKKANRKRFEFDLVRNLKHALRNLPDIKVKRVFGRMTIHFKDHRDFTDEEATLVREQLPKVFGLNSFSLGLLTEVSMDAIEKVVLDTFPKVLADFPDDVVTYRMRARRSNKRFPKASKDLEIHFAEILLEKYKQLKVDLTNAELSIELEIRDEWAFISFGGRVECEAGLPVGSSSPTLALLSGGIDSPVACKLIMARGCHVNFLTFHSYPYTTPELLEKVAKIAGVLNEYQVNGRLFACNISEAQKEMRDNCQARFRTILYRRLMFRVAERLADALGDEALVTGESLGQVASQTIRNLNTINMSTDMLILRPLLAQNKETAIAEARKMGTYDLSNIQCADSCTVFQPDSPATNARPRLLDFEEAKLDYEQLLEISLDNISEISIPDGEETPFKLPASEEEGDQ